MLERLLKRYFGDSSPWPLVLLLLCMTIPLIALISLFHSKSFFFLYHKHTLSLIYFLVSIPLYFFGIVFLIKLTTSTENLGAVMGFLFVVVLFVVAFTAAFYFFIIDINFPYSLEKPAVIVRVEPIIPKPPVVQLNTPYYVNYIQSLYKGLNSGTFAEQLNVIRQLAKETLKRPLTPQETILVVDWMDRNHYPIPEDKMWAILEIRKSLGR